MSTPVIFFVLAGVLMVAGVVLRESQVPGAGTIGRSRWARLITIGIAVTTIAAAATTLQRLMEMAL